MSRKYTYIACDLVTNRVIAEVPFYGVNLNRQISGAADATFSINLDNGILPNVDTIEATLPGRTIVYVDVNGVLVGGWIVYSRTYQSQAKVLNMTARTVESYPDIRDVATSFLRTETEQRNAFCDLWTAMQAEDVYSNIGVLLPDGYPFSTQVPVDSEVDPWEYKTYGAEMSAIADTDTGFDWTIDIYYDQGVPTKKLRLGYPNLGQPLGPESPVFEYPGNVRNYYYPETTSNAGTHVTGIGAGEGAAMLVHQEIDYPKLMGGYPRMDYHVPMKAEQDPVRLASLTRMLQSRASVPTTVPSVQVSGDVLGTFDMGDMGKLVAKDPRFPGGISLGSRIIGWAITPPSSDSVEEMRVIFEGGDAG